MPFPPLPLVVTPNEEKPVSTATDDWTDAPAFHDHAEGDDFRVPSGYTRCRRKQCQEPPVADMRRIAYLRSRGDAWRWWAYCAAHLAEYNREVRNGVVWWKAMRGPSR